MKKIRVNVSTPYDVVIERGILKNCGSLIADITKSRKTVIITDDIVEKLYCDTLENTLAENGFSFSRFVFKRSNSSLVITLSIHVDFFIFIRQLFEISESSNFI